MSSLTYIQTILAAFAQMDIEKLRFYLKDDYSYQDTTKEIFLNEVANIFKAHKNSGDTELLIYTGKCSNGECANCGKGGYRFIGNNTKNYTDFIFIEQGDDIQDIFNCETFETIIDAGELNSRASIFINEDDQISFNKTPEYWAKVNAAKAAYDEMITIPPREVDFEDIQYWLSKHNFTFTNIGGFDLFQPTMKWTPFTSLYEELNELIKYSVNYHNDLKLANQTLEEIRDEERLLDWLLTYENLFQEMRFEVRYGPLFTNREDEPDSISPINFSDVRFIHIAIFKYSYEKYHAEMLNKFSTYTEDDISEIYNDKEYQNNTDHIHSLRFHLDKRKEAEELGFDIPLFLHDSKE